MLATLACLSATRGQTLGFVGLGTMGTPMARNLLRNSLQWTEKPDKLVVHDAHAPLAEQFAQAHANSGVDVHCVASGAEMAEQAGTIISMVPSSADVEQLYLGSKGILEGLHALSNPSDALLLDSTTLSPKVSARVARTVQEANSSWVMLDTPVSGGVVGATNGTLTFMVGGPPTSTQELQIKNRAQQVLTTMGSNVVWCGGNGSGLGAKLANNMLLGVSMAGVCEAMALGLALGLDKRVLADLINHSTGRCWASNVNNPVPGSLDSSTPADRNYEGGFATRLMAKDLGLALDVAQEEQLLDLPATQRVRIMYDALCSEKYQGKYATKDFGVLYKALQDGHAVECVATRAGHAA